MLGCLDSLIRYNSLGATQRLGSTLVTQCLCHWHVRLRYQSDLCMKKERVLAPDEERISCRVQSTGQQITNAEEDLLLVILSLVDFGAMLWRETELLELGFLFLSPSLRLRTLLCQALKYDTALCTCKLLTALRLEVPHYNQLMLSSLSSQSRPFSACNTRCSHKFLQYHHFSTKEPAATGNLRTARP